MPTSEAKLLYVYFLSCEHQNSAGCFRIPGGYACADLGWTREQYTVARIALVEGEMIAFDGHSSEVFILRWFKHNPPMNAKHQAGTMRLIGEIESDRIRELVEAEFEQVSVTDKAPENPFGGTSRLMESRLMRGGR